MRRSHKTIVAYLLCCMLLGCATPPTDPQELKIYKENNDPLEPMNRSIFDFNISLDKYVLAPIDKGYRLIIPSVVRTGIDNFFTNLKQPLYTVNSLLQGDLKSAGIVVGRFAINTTFGFFGIMDAASEMEIPIIKRNFGQTLAVWHVGSGPYLMVPFLGPSTVRDGTGMIVDAFGDPLSLVLYKPSPALPYVKMGVNAFLTLDRAHDLMDSIQRTSTDYYAAMRSMWQQKNQKDINDIMGIKPDQKPDYDFEFPSDEDE